MNIIIFSYIILKRFKLLNQKQVFRKPASEFLNGQLFYITSCYANKISSTYMVWRRWRVLFSNNSYIACSRDNTCDINKKIEYNESLKMFVNIVKWNTLLVPTIKHEAIIILYSIDDQTKESPLSRIRRRAWRVCNIF